VVEASAYHVKIMKRHKKMQIQRSFTLIELLVTISIIAVLAGMLIPVLNHSRDKARTAECAGRQRQVGVALQVYATDNGDMLTPINLSSPDGGNKLDKNWWTNLLANNTYLPMPSLWNNEKFGFVNNGVLSCPSAAVVAGGKGGGGIGLLESQHMSSYAISQKLTNFRKPSEKLLTSDAWVGDSRAAWFAIFCPECAPWYGIDWHESAFRHDSAKNANIMLVDGHIASRTYDSLKRNEADIFGHQSR